MAQKDERLSKLGSLIEERGVKPLVDEGVLNFKLVGKGGQDLAQPAMEFLADGRKTTWRLGKMVAGLVPGAAPILKAISAIEGVGRAIAKSKKLQRKREHLSQNRQTRIWTNRSPNERLFRPKRNLRPSPLNPQRLSTRPRNRKRNLKPRSLQTQK